MALRLTLTLLLLASGAYGLNFFKSSKTFSHRYTYVNDTIHRIKRTSFDGNPVADYAYNPMGTVASIIFGNGANQIFSYDPRDRLTRTRVTTPAGSNAFENVYDYDEVGNRTGTKEENGRRQFYEYDRLYRLTRVGYGGLPPNAQISQKYTYDSVGNRETHLGESFAHLYAYKANENQLTNVTIAPAGKITYTWDPNGNLANQSHYRGNEKFKEMNLSWDEEDRLTSLRFKNLDLLQQTVTGKDEIKDTFVSNEYDDSGARIRKSFLYGNDLQKSTTFIRKGLSVVEEYEGVAGPQLKRVYGGGLLRMDALTGKKHFFAKDALGSTSLVMDEVGGVEARYKYDAWGSEEYSEEKAGFGEAVRKYSGKEIDTESGLQYYGARYYDSFLGRWTSKDSLRGRSINPQTLNRYSFVDNNPLKFIDVGGLVKIALFGQPHQATSSEHQEVALQRAEEGLWASLKDHYRRIGFTIADAHSGKEAISSLKKLSSSADPIEELVVVSHGEPQGLSFFMGPGAGSLYTDEKFLKLAENPSATFDPAFKGAASIGALLKAKDIFWDPNRISIDLRGCLTSYGQGAIAQRFLEGLSGKTSFLSVYGRGSLSGLWIGEKPYMHLWNISVGGTSVSSGSESSHGEPQTGDQSRSE